MTTVLIADDDPDILELVRFKLETAGLEVVATSDGQSALDAALADPPALAVLDVMMPRLSGIEVCRSLKSTPATAGVPVMLLTARSQEVDVERGFGVGADDYLIKPFSPRELLTRVRALIGRGDTA
ncbi:response regulator [Actinomarinicola tropica]|uniref:Response regulator n=1 Tax=Actinomarinicola tropica TaxID=2789776 RepID=A0A5Q2RG59_9ACTN|nr:response regulator [Actinomarinicola tropica]QGG94693.1 response regulator [Actinomarinicola tropica]